MTRSSGCEMLSSADREGVRFPSGVENVNRPLSRERTRAKMAISKKARSGAPGILSWVCVHLKAYPEIQR